MDGWMDGWMEGDRWMAIVSHSKSVAPKASLAGCPHVATVRALQSVRRPNSFVQPSPSCPPSSFTWSPITTSEGMWIQRAGGLTYIQLPLSRFLGIERVRTGKPHPSQDMLFCFFLPKALLVCLESLSGSRSFTGVGDVSVSHAKHTQTLHGTAIYANYIDPPNHPN